MSATINWQPLDTNPRHIDTGAPSAFMEEMTRAFEVFPKELSEADIPVLRGMAAIRGSGGEYHQLIEHIKAYGSIRLWITH